TIMHAPEDTTAAIPNSFADDRALHAENENRNFIVTWNHNMHPTLINEFRYMFYNRKFVNRGFGAGSGFNGKVNLPAVDADALARVTVTGYTSIGQSTVERVQNPIQTQQFIDSVLWDKGNHSIKTGLEFRRSCNIRSNNP